MPRKKRKPARRPWPVLWLAIGVGCATFLLYLRSLGSGFTYDAEIQVLADGYIHDSSHFAEVITLRVLGRDVLDGNRPVQLLSLMCDALLWGRRPFGYHLTSNLLHSLNAALVFLLIVRLAGNGAPPGNWERLAAALAALAFAFHPVNVEPVAEVSSREDPLAAFFLLLGLIAATEFARRTGKAAMAWAAGCVAAIVLATGAKETGATGPFLLAFYWLLLRRGDPWKRWAALIACAFAVTALFLAARFALAPRDSQIFLHPPVYVGGSLDKVFEIQPRIWVFLLTNIFRPLHLSADYVPQNVMGITLAPALLALLLFLLLQGLASWKSRTAFFGAAVFWSALAPVSNFIPIYRFAADRYLYLPMIGLAITLGGVLFLARRPGMRIALTAVLSLLLALLAGLSWQRQAVFANSLNLWRDASAKSPFSYTAADNLGYALLPAGDYEAALRAFEKAAAISQSKKADPWAGMALALEALGREKDAEEALRRAIAIDEMYGDPDRLVAALITNREKAAILAKIRARMRGTPP